MLNTTVTQSLELQPNPHQAIYSQLLRNQDIQGIQELGYQDGSKGFVPLDPQFHFYYSEYSKGFQEFASNLNHHDTNKPSEIVLAITQSELEEATENLIYDYVNSDTEADEKAIAQLIKNRLQSITEDILNNPQKYLDSQELEQCFSLSDSSYRKLMELSIPLPHTL